MVDRIETIDDLAAFLTRKDSEPFNLFVGSTISWSSPAHAPSVSDVLKSLFADLLEALCDSPDLQARVRTTLSGTAAAHRQRDIPFESLWERVARVTGTDFVANVLVRLYTGGKPNVHHEAIAWLARHEFIRTIFTTNYDELIEQAFTGSNSSTGWAIDSIDDRDAMVLRIIPASLEPDRKFAIIKLHGTLSKPKTMAFMFPQITTGLSDNTAAVLGKSLASAPILFAGYGCNDWDLRSLLRTPVDSVWATHRENWSSVDERCKSIAAHHHQTKWYLHNLDLRKAKPEDSVLVQLARFFGWTGCTTSLGDNDKPRPLHILAKCDHRTKLEILAELLDSLALRVASDVFAEAARQHTSQRDRARLEVASYIAVSHDMSIPEQVTRGENLLRQSEWTLPEGAAIRSQLAFAQLIGGSKLAGLSATFRLLPIIRRLGREAGTRDLLGAENTWTSEDRLVAITLVKAREVFAHNILRLAWFHVPGRLGAAVRCVRKLGFRRVFALWARRMLRANRPWIAKVGDLASIANFGRESAHALCLTGGFDEALERALTAEKALGWGRWYQWQANAVRTRGWVWLHIGGRLAPIRRFADQEARSLFMEAVELASQFAPEGGEMVDDRIKARLELKRLDTLHGRRFEWERQLQSDLAVVKERNPEAHSRYQLIADHPPRSREPLG